FSTEPEVLTAADGDEALDRLRSAAAVDLVITDVNMPRMDGITLVRELRLLKAKAQQAKERAAIEQARRQLDDRDKYRLGGLALAAGLGGWSEAELRAGFAFLAAMDAAQRAALPPVAANADSKAGGDAVAAPVTSAMASTLMPVPTPEAEEATLDQAQAEPMAAAMPASPS
ncbi:MAG: response regulator, partial [Candidatus Baltobacteraceae bacterium]